MNFYDITEYKDHHDNIGQVKQYSWAEFVKKLSKAKKDNLIHSEYLRLKDSKSDKDKEEASNRKAAAGGFIAGKVEGKRGNENCQYRNMLNLDLDKCPADILETLELYFEGYAYVVYSTRSDDEKGQRKYRAIIPLSENISPADFKTLTEWTILKLNTTGIDTASAVPSQMMFYPTVSKDQQYYFKEYQGDFYDPIENLGEYQEIGYNFINPSTDEYKEFRKQDPRNRNDIVGAFCKVYDIDTAIQEFLPDTYEYIQGYGSDCKRYKYTGANSKAGAYTLKGLFLKSHHTETDPAADGHFWDAFNLIMLHNHNNDFSSMAKWAESLPPVKAELMKYKDNQDPDIINKHADQLKNIRDDLLAELDNAADKRQPPPRDKSEAEYRDTNLFELESYTPTGIYNLDKALEGGIRKGIYFITAQPGGGKTSLVLQIAYNLAKQGRHIIYFSYDMDAKRARKRNIFREAYRKNKAFYKIKDISQIEGNDELNRIWLETQDDYYNNIGDNILIYNSDGWNTENIKAKISQEYKNMLYYNREADPPLVVIDYLQQVQPPEALKHLSDSRGRLEAVISELRQMLKQYETTFLIISTASRGNYEGELGQDAFKGSSEIEYSGDNCSVMQPKREWIQSDIDTDKNGKPLLVSKRMKPDGNGNIQVIMQIVKDRYTGEYPTIFLEFNPAAGYFGEQEYIPLTIPTAIQLAGVPQADEKQG